MVRLACIRLRQLRWPTKPRRMAENLEKNAENRELISEWNASKAEPKGWLVIDSDVAGCAYPPSSAGGECLRHHRCSAVVAVHWPRFLLILWTSNVGSPEESLAFVPSSSTRSPGFRDLLCWLVRL